METTYEPHIIKICKYLAYVSAGIGTTILIVAFISRNEDVAYLGLAYTILASFINIIFLLTLFAHLFFNKEYWHKILATSILMLTNIPLCILYIYLQSFIKYQI